VELHSAEDNHLRVLIMSSRDEIMSVRETIHAPGVFSHLLPFFTLWPFRPFYLIALLFLANFQPSHNTDVYASLYVTITVLHYRCTHVAVILTCPRNPHERLGTQYSE